MMHQPISQVSLSSTSTVLSAEKSAQQLQQEKAERDEKYAALAARKEALEKMIEEKNEELKLVCVQEAELTGQLPLETPLEPGETPPPFRRRVGTTFTIPEVLIDKLKSDEEQTLAALELEYKIMSQITCAAMRMASDVSLKRSVRRQRRVEYQQNSKRLTELEMKLNEARKNQKFRKKPRPISDTVGMEGSAADKEPNEGGFGGTNLTRSVRSYSASDRPPSSSSSSLSHQQHHHHHHHNHMHESTKHYLKSGSPEVRSHRQQLQRLGSGGFISSHHQHALFQRNSPTNHYQTITGTPSELERLSRHDTAFLGTPKNFSPFLPLDSSYKHLHSHTARPAASQNFLDENELLDDSPVRRPSLESRSSSSRWKTGRYGSLDRKKKMAQSTPSLDTQSVEGLDAILPEDVVDRPNLVMPSTRPKNPKRAETKQLHAHNHHPNLPPPVHQRQKHVEETWTPPPMPRVKEPPPPPAEALLPGQTYPEPAYGHGAVERVRAASGSLIRTQSLGAVSSASSGRSADSRSIRDMYPATSYTQQQQYVPMPKRNQQPEPPERPPSRRPLEAAKESPSLSGSFSSLHLKHETAAASPLGSVCSGGSSDLRKGVQGQETFEMVMPFESPKNHLVIQPGRWQPYREESKPFEMSDCYKYSNKFRNAKPANGQLPEKQQPLHVRLEEETAVCLPKMLPSPTPSMSPQQKGVYQPLQPMTCQPVNPNKALSPELPAKQNKVMSPNMSLNISDRESLADAFSTEMLAWIQDKSSVPRSATLV